MHKHEVACVGDLLKIVNEVAKRNKDRQLYFRGQADASWGIASSLCRLLNTNSIKPHPVDNMPPTLASKISHSRLATELFDSFKDKFVLYSEVNIIKGYELNDIDLHVMAQHYQLPTRVVDLTKNPLISLYFATEENKPNTDVTVFILKEGYSETSSSVFQSKLDKARNKYYNFYQSIRPYMRSGENSSLTNAVQFVKNYKYDFFDSKQDLILCQDDIHPDHCALLGYLGAIKDASIEKMLDVIAHEDGFNFRQPHSSISIYNSNLQVITPLPINQRIKNQQGLLLFSNIINQPIFEATHFTDENTVSDTDFDSQNFTNESCLKIIIKYKHVAAIRKELERYGITRDFIYPELPNYTVYMKEKILERYI
ncbi:FRG domain-containing protein [Candidatus Pantoea bituminis]|uniref:FRG domain-containing protein n=1 Tax=Candidatus Pantoea bituminis TaxID=2831036 RepID=UPI001C060DE1|nr:FRG domain-containing protein [Pantoea bituminis]